MPFWRRMVRLRCCPRAAWPASRGKVSSCRTHRSPGGRNWPRDSPRGPKPATRSGGAAARRPERRMTRTSRPSASIAISIGTQRARCRRALWVRRPRRRGSPVCRAVVRRRIAGLGSHASPGSELSLLKSECRDMELSLSDAMRFLPAYDAKLAQEVRPLSRPAPPRSRCHRPLRRPPQLCFPPPDPCGRRWSRCGGRSRRGSSNTRRGLASASSPARTWRRGGRRDTSAQSRAGQKDRIPRRRARRRGRRGPSRGQAPAARTRRYSRTRRGRSWSSAPASLHGRVRAGMCG